MQLMPILAIIHYSFSPKMKISIFEHLDFYGKKFQISKPQRNHSLNVQAHSAKADQNPYPRGLGTPASKRNVPERRAKPNCFCNFMILISFSWASSQNVLESRVLGTKRNLVPPLRALLPLSASSRGIALSAELRLARRYVP